MVRRNILRFEGTIAWWVREWENHQQNIKNDTTIHPQNDENHEKHNHEKEHKEGNRIQELSAQNGGSILNSNHAWRFGGSPNTCCAPRRYRGTPRQARRGRGEVRWRGDTRGEGEEATA